MSDSTLPLKGADVRPSASEEIIAFVADLEAAGGATAAILSGEAATSAPCTLTDADLRKLIREGPDLGVIAGGLEQEARGRTLGGGGAYRRPTHREMVEWLEQLPSPLVALDAVEMAPNHFGTTLPADIARLRYDVSSTISALESAFQLYSMRGVQRDGSDARLLRHFMWHD